MMSSLDRRFTSEQRRKVEAAVLETELGTSCEVIPVVAASSGRYDRGEDPVGLWFAILSAAGVWWFVPHRPADAATGSWGSGSPLVGLLALVVAIVIGFLVGAIVASQVRWLRRLATPRRQMAEEVARRAREVFFDRRVHHTTGGTGVLVYVSLFEHVAVVLADSQVVEHPALGQAFLDRLCGTLTASLATHHPAEALVEAIQLARGPLSQALPRLSDDVNEHPDALVLLD